MNTNEPNDSINDQISNATDSSDSDLRAQARMLRQRQSTADIILTDSRPPVISRRAIIYICLSAVLLISLAYIFLAPESSNTMSRRIDTMATVMAESRETEQPAAPENEHQPDPDQPEKAELPEGAQNPFTVNPADATPDATGRQPATSTARKSPAPSQAKPTAQAPPPAIPAVKKPSGPAGPEKEAYNYLLDTKTVFASMVQGVSAEYNFDRYSVDEKSEGVFLFTFYFTEDGSGEAATFIWQINMNTRTIRPIGLNATKVSRLE